MRTLRGLPVPLRVQTTRSGVQTTRSGVPAARSGARWLARLASCVALAGIVLSDIVPAAHAAPDAADTSGEVLRPVATLGGDAVLRGGDAAAPAAGSVVAPVAGAGAAAGPGAAAGSGAAAGFGAVSAASAAAGPAAPGQFRTIARDDTILYDGPSAQSRRLYLAPAGMPVQLVDVDGTWAHVRDAVGDSAWVPGSDLAGRRLLVVVRPATLYREPRPGAGAVFDVAPGVLLEPAAMPADGFVAVRHVDGSAGYISVASVWGG